MEFKQILLDDMIAVELTLSTPDRIKLPSWQKYLEGVVVAAGPGRPLYTGGRAEMMTKVGDKVTFGPTMGMDTNLGVGRPIRLMHDTDVDTVLG